MKLIITTPPNTLLKGDGIDSIDPTITVQTLIDNIIKGYPDLDREGHCLIIDHNEQFSRIYDNDPMNMWYGGQIGDIFRIINSSTMRYRRVIKALPEPKSKKVKNNSGKFSNVTANKYYKAHNSVIQMLLDRQRESESDSKLDSSLILNKFRKSYENVQTYFTQDNLYEMNIGEHETIMNKRGKRMFVLYLKRNDDRMLGNKKSAFYSMAQDTINEIIDLVSLFDRLFTF